MELRHLRYFVAVAEELNFRRAADRVHISQPSLSTQIRQLEESIGAPLLNRSTHHVSLTPAGRSFLEDCQRILRDTQDSARSAQRIGRGEAGQLSIGYVGSLGYGVLPAMLRAYRASYPDVNLRLVEMDTTAQIQALTDGQLDLGFVGLGLATQASELELELAAEEKLVAILPDSHPLARRTTLRLPELSREKLYLSARENAPIYNPWVLALCQQAGFQPPQVCEVDQLITVLNYVAAGLGVSIVPAQYGRLFTIGVRYVSLNSPTPRYRYYTAWRPQNQHPAVRHFVEIVRQNAKPGSSRGRPLRKVRAAE